MKTDSLDCSDSSKYLQWFYRVCKLSTFLSKASDVSSWVLKAFTEVRRDRKISIHMIEDRDEELLLNDSLEAKVEKQVCKILKCTLKLKKKY